MIASVQNTLICLYLLVLGLASQGAAAEAIANPLVVDAATLGPIELGYHAGMLEDETNSWRIQDVIAKDFVPLNARVKNLGFSQSTFWTRFTIRNLSLHPQEYILDSRYIPMDHLYLYFKKEKDNDYIEIKNGDRAFKDSPLALKTRTTTFRVTLHPGENTFYIKAKTWGVTELNLVLWSVNEFHHNAYAEAMFFCFIFGIMAIMALYNASLYLVVKEKSYLYYVIYTVTSLAFYNSQVGYGNILLPNVSFFANEFYILGVGISIVSAILFSSTYLELKKHSPRVHKSLMAIVVLIAVSIPPAVAWHYPLAGKLILLYSTVFYLYLLAIGVALLIKRNKSALFYVLGWSSFLVFAVLNALSVAGKIEKSWIISNGVYIGAVVELFLFSFAVGDSIRRRQKKAEAKEKELIHKLAQEHELVTDLNRNLEARVEERTKDIAAILEHIDLGIFTITSEKKIHKEYSLAMHEIFGSDDLSDKDPIRILHGGRDTDASDKDKAALDFILGEPVLTFELNKDNLSKLIELDSRHGTKYIEVSWSAIEKDGLVDRILVTSKNITNEKMLKAEAEKKDTEARIVRELTSTSAKIVAKFFRSSQMFLTQNGQLIHYMREYSQDSLKVLFINAHTLKGMARGIHLSGLREALHQHESYLSAVRDSRVMWKQDVALVQHRGICEAFTLYQHVNDTILGRAVDRANLVEITSDEVHEFIRQLNSFQQGNAAKSQELQLLKSKLIQKVYSKSESFFKDIAKAANSLARDLNKEYPHIEITDSDILISQEGRDVLASIFVHLIRNSMDHGIEAPDLRRSRGKDVKGTLTFKMRPQHANVLVEFADDGQGLDLPVIRKIAVLKGLMHEGQIYSQTQIANIIFEAGFSTASRVTDISGRGVGMDAVKRFVEKAQGRISIDVSDEPHFDGCHQFKILIELPGSLFYSASDGEFSQLRSA